MRLRPSGIRLEPDSHEAGIGSESKAGVVRVEMDRVEFRKLDPSTAPPLLLGPVVYSDDFKDPASGWSLDGTGMCKRGYDKGIFFFQAQTGWDGSFSSVVRPKFLPHNFQVEVVGRILGEAPIVKGGWGVIVGREDGERPRHQDRPRRGAHSDTFVLGRGEVCQR